MDKPSGSSAQYRFVEFADWNRISERGAKLLAVAYWPSLQELQLFSNQICDEGAHNLKYGNWPKLTHLNIGSTTHQHRLQ